MRKVIFMYSIGCVLCLSGCSDFSEGKCNLVPEERVLSPDFFAHENSPFISEGEFHKIVAISSFPDSRGRDRQSALFFFKKYNTSHEIEKQSDVSKVGVILIKSKDDAGNFLKMVFNPENAYCFSGTSFAQTKLISVSSLPSGDFRCAQEGFYFTHEDLFYERKVHLVEREFILKTGGEVQVLASKSKGDLTYKFCFNFTYIQKRIK